MAELKLTPEQTEAIFSTGQNILVSASAGSGKTFVMANRIVEKVRQGIDIDCLFISTFTKKAAAELKIRLERDLKNGRNSTNEPDEKRRFTLALQKLSNADIGTMDSFTQKLVRQHFNRINIDPNFRILADKAESDLIKQDIFDQLVEEYLANDKVNTDGLSSSEFKKLIKNFSKDRNITGFQEMVYSVYNFMTATENPLGWLNNEYLTGFKKFQKFNDTPQSNPFDVLQNWNELFELLETSLTNGVLSGAGSVNNANAILDSKDEIISTLTNRDFSAYKTLFLQLKIDFRFGKKSSDEILQAQREEFKGIKSELVGTKSSPGAIWQFYDQIKHTDIIEKYQPYAFEIVISLQKFMKTFYEKYLDRKIQENAFDYSDIAHFAIQILEENPDIRADLQAHYHEIMIDEYQDTSHTQERMLILLSNGHNLFMVGDIKQSIYGFRLADPGLFLEKYKTYDDEENPNQLIRLKENFRSRGEVLNFTNDVFKHLMNEEIGEMTYGKEEKLIQGNTTDYPVEIDTNFYPELLLYDETQNEGEGEEEVEDETQVQISNGEIKVAAQRIQQLIQSGVAPKEIAILVRSKSYNNKIEDILNSYGIPVVLDEGRVDFLKSMEVLVMLDVLRAIDNPLYDISIVSMLRSPLFKFNEDELTRISLQAGNDTRYWEKINLSLSEQGLKQELIGQELKSKLEKFNHKFTGWRKLVNKISIHELLWKIYVETYYFDYVGALPNGEMRQANLQALSVRAESYESSGFKGLFKFIRLIDKFMEQNNDLAAVNIKLPQNAVRVMTFHKSKGLEFDYVFLMNLQSRFNERDLRENGIMTRENGIGIRYVADLKNEPEVSTDFPYVLVKMETFPYLVNQEKKKRANLSEEMRVLYVAFTRAKKKLFMIGKIKDSKDKSFFDQYNDSVLVQNILTDKYRANASGFQNWILALSNATKLSMNLHIYSKKDLEFADNDFHEPLVFKNLLKSSEEYDGLMESSDQIQKAYSIMNYQYPNQAATELSSIQTPSQVKKRSYEKKLELGDVQPVGEYIRAKKFTFSDLKPQKVSATEIGSATHSLMQLADFSQPNKEKFEQILNSMPVDELIKKQINITKILTLFETEFGQFLIDNVENTVKEAPFSMLKTDSIANEQYIVRGICDGYVKIDKKIVLFDYKTDHFSRTNQINEIKERYQVQMDLYAEALLDAFKNVNKVDKYLILLGGPGKVKVEKLN